MPAPQQPASQQPAPQQPAPQQPAPQQPAPQQPAPQQPAPQRPAPQMPASHVFNQAFPHGYELIQTSGKGLLCGLRAVINSLQALKNVGHAVPVPDLHSLQEMMKTSQYQERGQFSC
jgi:pyruvate/2-oxoglutarate dehydrogenase complex dihydrolipoamide acyltransferase (E2) component